MLIRPLIYLMPDFQCSHGEFHNGPLVCIMPFIIITYIL